MGQQEILRAVEELEITSLEELREMFDISVPSITRSLSSLTKWKEIHTEILGRRTIYFSNEVWEEMINE